MRFVAIIAPSLVMALGLAACGPKPSASSNAHEGPPTNESPTTESSPAHADEQSASTMRGAPARVIPPIDESALSAVTDALAKVPSDDDRAAFAARTFAELERGRVTTLLLEGFTKFAESPSDRRDAVVQQTLSINVEWFEIACEQGDASVLVQMSQRPASERAGLLIETCGFEAVGLVEEDSAPETNGWAAALAHTALAQLSAGGPVDERERALLAAMLGH